MVDSLLVILLAFEWLFFISGFAPVALSSRRIFIRHPNFGLAAWFASLLSAGVAVALALFVAIVSLVSTFEQLSGSPMGSTDWFAALLLSFLPWLAMAAGGIALALANLRLDPLIHSAKVFHRQLDVVGRPDGVFEGVSVRLFTSDAAIVFAGKFGGRSAIYISTGLKKALSEQDLAIVLTHEFAHVKFRHNRLKAMARFVKTLTPWLRVSRALVLEVELLCEAAANRFAAKRFGAGEVGRVSQIVLGR